MRNGGADVSEPEYIATREHMRGNYINLERHRNAFKGKEFFQTDEELGAEFDRGMAEIEAEARAEGAGNEQMY
jgi:hypothetical protein